MSDAARCMVATEAEDEQDEADTLSECADGDGDDVRCLFFPWPTDTPALGSEIASDILTELVPLLPARTLLHDKQPLCEGFVLVSESLATVALVLPHIFCSADTFESLQERMFAIDFAAPCLSPFDFFRADDLRYMHTMKFGKGNVRVHSDAARGPPRHIASIVPCYRDLHRLEVRQAWLRDIVRRHEGAFILRSVKRTAAEAGLEIAAEDVQCPALVASELLEDHAMAGPHALAKWSSDREDFIEAFMEVRKHSVAYRRAWMFKRMHVFRHKIFYHMEHGFYFDLVSVGAMRDWLDRGWTIATTVENEKTGRPKKKLINLRAELRDSLTHVTGYARDRRLPPYDPQKSILNLWQPYACERVEHPHSCTTDTGELKPELVAVLIRMCERLCRGDEEQLYLLLALTAARLREPWHPFAHVPVLFGPQNAGKSTFFRLLQAIIGKHLCEEFSYADQVFGRFNATSMEFPFVCLEEATLSQSTYTQLRAQVHTINQKVERKGLEVEKLAMARHVWLNSNTIGKCEILADERRFLVLEVMTKETQDLLHAHADFTDSRRWFNLHHDEKIVSMLADLLLHKLDVRGYLDLRGRRYPTRALVEMCLESFHTSERTFLEHLCVGRVVTGHKLDFDNTRDQITMDQFARTLTSFPSDKPYGWMKAYGISMQPGKVLVFPPKKELLAAAELRLPGFHTIRLAKPKQRLWAPHWQSYLDEYVKCFKIDCRDAAEFVDYFQSKLLRSYTCASVFSRPCRRVWRFSYLLWPSDARRTYLSWRFVFATCCACMSSRSYPQRLPQQTQARNVEQWIAKVHLENEKLRQLSEDCVAAIASLTLQISDLTGMMIALTNRLSDAEDRVRTLWKDSDDSLFTHGACYHPAMQAAAFVLRDSDEDI
jgi:hypothetical protein